MEVCAEVVRAKVISQGPVQHISCRFASCEGEVYHRGGIAISWEVGILSWSIVEVQGEVHHAVNKFIGQEGIPGYMAEVLFCTVSIPHLVV